MSDLPRRCEHCGLPRLRNLKQLSQETGISYWTLRGAYQRGELVGAPIGADGLGPILVDPADFERYLESRRRAARRRLGIDDERGGL
jgi:hypothetical protein